MDTRIYLDILPQPDDTTCGPTCLHAVYRYFGEEIGLQDVVRETTALEEGGTLAMMLACHALRRGYSARIYTYNLTMFDPTWFVDGKGVSLAERLAAQAVTKNDVRLQLATQSYLEFLRLGGEVRFEDLSIGLITKYLRRNVPILTGLSATYLYHCAREVNVGYRMMDYDDVSGEPQGHFVVICGYDSATRQALVADPLHDNPAFATHEYLVPIQRLVGAILLGVLTYDANFLILEPPGTRRRHRT